MQWQGNVTVAEAKEARGQTKFNQQVAAIAAEMVVVAPLWMHA
jgi:hypothetical protein